MTRGRWSYTFGKLMSVFLGGSAYTMVRDIGYVATLEFHVPLWLDKAERSRLQLVPFASYGAGWNNSRATPSPTDISSAGIGLATARLAQAEAARVALERAKLEGSTALEQAEAPAKASLGQAETEGRAG